LCVVPEELVIKIHDSKRCIMQNVLATFVMQRALPVSP